MFHEYLCTQRMRLGTDNLLMSVHIRPPRQVHGRGGWRGRRRRRREVRGQTRWESAGALLGEAGGSKQEDGGGMWRCVDGYGLRSTRR